MLVFVFIDFSKLFHCFVDALHLSIYSSRGILNFSIKSERFCLINHGTYSAKCSELSVTK